MHVGQKTVSDQVVKFELAHDEVRLPIDGQENCLERVIARRLLSGQVKDVLRTRDDKHVDVALGELDAGCRHTPIEFRFRKNGLAALLDSGVDRSHACPSQIR